MTGIFRSPGDDRGAVLIHVALAVLALVAFLTIVADFGLMWTARRQAQNSADAGAIAGATGLGYDDPTDYSNTGAAKQNAYLATQTNEVWGQPPFVNISSHITFPLTPLPDCDPDGDGFSQCVRVEVHRDLDNFNALPMLFGHLLGLTNQNTRASAILRSKSSVSARSIKLSSTGSWNCFHHAASNGCSLTAAACAATNGAASVRGAS